MNIIYYYHIPKCAGTFISENLIRNADKKVFQDRMNEELEWMETPYDNPINPERNILFNFNKLPVPSLKDRNLQKECKNQLKKFMNTLPNLNFKTLYIHHHMGYPGLLDIYDDILSLKNQIESTGGKFYLFTCVREMEGFLLSKINYQVNERNNNSTWEGQINRKSQHNSQSKYLLHNHSHLWDNKDIEITKEQVKKVLDIIDKVYTTKTVSEIPRDLKRLLNEEIKWDTTKKNVSKKTIIIPNKIKPHLIINNEIDRWLFEKYNKK